jgi:hypothetical protein
MLTAFSLFIRWASLYGHELRSGSHNELPEATSSASIGLSTSLSASFNFGYNAEDQSVFVVLEQSEFDWLPDLPIAEVLVGRKQLYVLTHEVVVDDVAIVAMAISIDVGQPKLWRAFPYATTIGFLCIRHTELGYQVIEEASQRYPLRYLDS